MPRGGATISLSAPSDGPLPGILFYHDRNSTGNVVHRFTGGAEMDLDSVLYSRTRPSTFRVARNSKAPRP